MFKVFPVVCIILFLLFFRSGYFLNDSTFWIGLCLIPYVLRYQRKQNRSLRFLPLVLLIMAAGFYVHAATVRYLLFTFTVILLIESCYQKISSLLLWIFLIISPLFQYLSEIFTFPIRIKLSEWTGHILQMAGFDVRISGNLIQMNGEEFSVDPACMGLRMIGLSFLAGVFLNQHYQHVTGKNLSFFTTPLLMTIVFVLNIFSNLIRILILVIFNIPPQDIMHDFVGILSLVIYVWVPLLFLIKLVYKQFSRPFPIQITSQSNTYSLYINCIILVINAFLILHKTEANHLNTVNPEILKSRNYNIKIVENGITQFRNKHALVYVKNINGFYATDHSPYICWKGSGYEFKSVKQEIISGNRIYTGTLQKGDENLQTAWWFSNNKCNTNSQLDWRWRMIKGEGNFALINVTSTSKEDLQLAIQEWL
ncbi:exosortase N [Dyadobacter psychrotolerans]|nr:exosortase N [Dyadobacter psychrotolerans]